MIEHQIAVNEDVKAPPPTHAQLSQMEGLDTPERQLAGIKDVPVDDAIGLVDAGSTTGVLTEDELPPTTQFISAPHVSSVSHPDVPAADHESEGGNTEEPDTDHPPTIIDNESKGDEIPGRVSSCPCQTSDLLNWPSLLKVTSPYPRLPWSPKYIPSTQRQRLLYRRRLQFSTRLPKPSAVSNSM